MKHQWETDDYGYLDEDRAPEWFEVVLYIIKSLLSGLGMITVAFLIGYWISK